MELENIIYEEQQKTHLIVVLVFILVAVFLLFIVFSPATFGQSILPQHTKITLLMVTVVDLILFWSFFRLTIKLTNKYLQIGFGLFKKKILLTDISDCLVEDYQKSVYLGYGIRFGRDKSVGYIARGGRGVRLKLKPRDYFFTSDNPEQIAVLLKQQISQIHR
ncbi:hypothetical protein KJ840_02270 [Patescibacteria group bacterium]|nr:hypothetical protein [Patescibacteria group bacterium]